MLGYDWVRLHAMFTALPVALLSMAIVFELVGLVLRRPLFRQVSLTLLIVGTLGAGAALIAGFRAEESIEHGTAIHELMEHHEQLAIITLGIFAAVTIWRLARERKMGAVERGVALVLALVGFGFLFNTGHHGGQLVFEHAAGIPSEVLRAELMNRTQGHEHAAGEEHEHATGEEHDHAAGGEQDHEHSPAGGTMTADSAGAGSHSNAPEGSGHTHPPGTPPHSHTPATPPHTHPADTPTHSHPPGTPPHDH